MDEQTATPITSNDILTSLAGILFFGPFIKSTHPFIRDYCNAWKLNFALFIITFIFSMIQYTIQSNLLYRLNILITLIICLISAFCIIACLNEIALKDIIPQLWDYPWLKDLILRPYTISKNLLYRIQNKWKNSEPFLP